jgi:hypothetical protein
VVTTATINDVSIFCHINPLIIDQLSATVALGTGIKALIKINNKGIITKIKETKINGINKTQLRDVVLLNSCVRYFKNLESKLIRTPFNLIKHYVYNTNVSI